MASRTNAGVEIVQDDKILQELESLQGAERLLGLTNALRKSGRVVQKKAKALCPPPGYPRDKPDRKPLRETIGVVTRNYPTAVVVYVGPQYPAGAHGHLVEFGHWLVRKSKKTGQKKIIKWVNAKPFMRPAADETKNEQHTVIVTSLRNSVTTIRPATGIPPHPLNLQIFRVGLLDGPGGGGLPHLDSPRA